MYTSLMRICWILNKRTYQILTSLAVGILTAANAQSACVDALIETARHPDGTVIPYILTSDKQSPKYALILMPGGDGRLDPKMRDGQLVFEKRGNFLIRSRELFCDSTFATASTDSTAKPERVLAIMNDLRARYPAAKLCIVGTSNGTLSTIALSEPLDGKVSCFVHTASRTLIGRLDTRKFQSRHLLVHHKNDGCGVTGYWGAEENHKDYNTPLFTMEGGVTRGDPCAGFSYHGFNGIEKETVEKIKAWISSEG